MSALKNVRPSRTQKRIAALMRLKFAMDHFRASLPSMMKPVEEATYRPPETVTEAVAYSGR